MRRFRKVRHVPLPLLAVIMAAILFAELARCEREGAKETAAEAEKSRRHRQRSQRKSSPPPTHSSRRKRKNGGSEEDGGTAREAASLREAPPSRSLPKSGWRLGCAILQSWFRLRVGVPLMELRESTAADRAAADVRRGGRVCGRAKGLCDRPLETFAPRL